MSTDEIAKVLGQAMLEKNECDRQIAALETKLQSVAKALLAVASVTKTAADGRAPYLLHDITLPDIPASKVEESIRALPSAGDILQMISEVETFRDQRRALTGRIEAMSRP
jgi:hypothetical protein